MVLRRLGQPDIAATLAAVAGEAIKAVWYQKWFVHLRHRPESGGAIVNLMKTGLGGAIQGHVSNTVLNAQAVQSSFAANNSYFLSQAFPGRFADPSGLSDGAWCGGWSLHHRPEIFLRRWVHDR